MNKLTALLITALLSFPLHADEVPLHIELPSTAVELTVTTVCLKGYLFALVVSVRGVALTQIHGYGRNGPLPCLNGDKS